MGDDPRTAEPLEHVVPLPTPPTPLPGAAEVVIVGGGVMGASIACHLAEAGLHVEVVESDTVLGGAVSTVERWPGVHVDRGSSAHVIIRHSGIVEELDLAAHGLRAVGHGPPPRYGELRCPAPGARPARSAGKPALSRSTGRP